MISVFEYTNYREFLKKRFLEMPKRGYGKMSELSRFLGVHTTLVSQIIKGHKDLSTDQAISVCDYFGLNEMETEYFVLLVSLERAGTQTSKRFFKKKLEAQKRQSRSISKRVGADAKISEEQRAIFYSDWAYSAVRQSVALPRIDTTDQVAEYLGLTRRKVERCLKFLIASGLCKQIGKEIEVGPNSTHLENSSPWVRAHHTNWRSKAIESLDDIEDSDLHYTLPLTISTEDKEVVRERLIKLIQDVRKIVDPSPSEEFYCMNLDWFKVHQSNR